MCTVHCIAHTNVSTTHNTISLNCMYNTICKENIICDLHVCYVETDMLGHVFNIFPNFPIFTLSNKNSCEAVKGVDLLETFVHTYTEFGENCEQFLRMFVLRTNCREKCFYIFTCCLCFPKN